MLLGEASKIVPVAAARFAAVRLAAAGAGLELDVVGSAGERVEISFASWGASAGGPSGPRADATDIMSKSVVLPSGGNATVVIP